MAPTSPTAPATPHEYECKIEEPGITRSVRVSGNARKKEPLEVTGKNLASVGGKPIKLKGTFQPVDPLLRMVRMKERFEKTDALLQELYKRVLKEAGTTGEAKLREVFQAREKLRDDRSKGTAEDGEYRFQPSYWESMLNNTIETIAFLNDYSGRGVPKGMAGSFRDASGGTLLMEPMLNGQLRFTLNVARGPAAIAGQMTGTARFTGTRATYKEELRKKDAAPGQQPAELTFTLRGGGHIIHVEAKNTGAYAAEGAYFNGDYYKFGPPR
jgi:hypothetical protein